MTLYMRYCEGDQCRSHCVVRCGVLIGVWCNGELDEELGGKRVCKDTRECCEDDHNKNNT